MGQAHYYSGTDRSIGAGTYNYYFNPLGDTAYATTTSVAYKFQLDYKGGAKVDLGDVDIYLYSPDGERHTVYYNFDGFGYDTDDNNDSDGANDYDIYFDGTGSESTFTGAFDGAQVNGNWRLRIDNDTGKTLTLRYLDGTIDYNSAPDMIVEAIDITGDKAVGEKVKIQATIKNIGETNHVGLGKDFDVQYLVNGKVVGTDSVSLGLYAGQSNKESFTYTVEQGGNQNVEVRISGISGEARTDNNSKSTGFFAESPDLAVKDIKIFGDVAAGNEVKIEAVLANIGGADYGGLFKGGFGIEYYVEKTDGTSRLIGEDSVSFGLTAGQENSESIKYTLQSSDTGKFSVKIVDTTGESSTTNNTRTELAGEDNAALHTVADSLENVKLGTLFARAVYGEGDIQSGYAGEADNGLSDDYKGYFDHLGWTVLAENELGNHYVPGDDGRFNAGGLFEGKAHALIPSWDAQSILAVGETGDGVKTLILSFRGTDSADSKGTAFLNGQAFSGDGLYHHYNAHKPLVEAALSYANDPHSGIQKMIVSGHSLGGSMADIFASVDGQRLDASIDLTVVSLASAGVDKTLYSQTELFDGFEQQHDYSVVDVDGSKVELTAPDHYIGISHNLDAVTFAERVDLDVLDGYVTNDVLRNNINFDDAITQLYLPNLDNGERSAGVLFPKGFGTHHVGGLYWAHISMLADDPLADYYTGSQKISFGLTDFSQVKDIDGTILPVFQDYTRLGETGYDSDTGLAALQGTAGDDFILGLSGNDVLGGGSGNDLLSGGLGSDIIQAGDGNDKIDGGDGGDVVNGGNGADTAWLGSGDDRYTDSTTDKGRDKVIGGQGSDDISTGAGRDWLNGGSGEDTLNGGAGRDKIVGGNGRDHIDAGAGNDLVTGGKGRDVVDLGDGKDKYIDTAQSGFAGRDIIAGGKGADTFVFHTGMSKDRITDFETGKDSLQLGDGLWDTTLTAQEFITSVASVTKAGVELDFGDGDMLVLQDLTTTAGLADDLVLLIS